MVNRIYGVVNRKMYVRQIQDRTGLAVRTGRGGLIRCQRCCDGRVVPIDYRVLSACRSQGDKAEQHYGREAAVVGHISSGHFVEVEWLLLWLHESSARE